MVTRRYVEARGRRTVVSQRPCTTEHRILLHERKSKKEMRKRKNNTKETLTCCRDRSTRAFYERIYPWWKRCGGNRMAFCEMFWLFVNFDCSAAYFVSHSEVQGCSSVLRVEKLFSTKHPRNIGVFISKFDIHQEVPQSRTDFFLLQQLIAFAFVTCRARCR